MSINGNNKEKAEEIMKNLSSAHDYIRAYKEETKSTNDTICKIVDISLKEYEKSLEKARITSQAKNAHASTRSNYGPNNQNVRNSNTANSNTRNSNTTNSNTRNSNATNSNKSNNRDQIRELKFNGGTLTQILDKNGNHVIKNNTFAYNFLDSDGKNHMIYSENTFFELADPSNSFHIELKMLNKSNLDRADSYDIENDFSQFGYVGYTNKQMGFQKNQTVISSFKKNQQRKPIIYLAEQENKKQKTISLINGQQLYGYTIVVPIDNIKQDIYFENNPTELVAMIKKCKSNGLNINQLILDSMDRAINSQYGYAGKITDTDIEVTPKITEELKIRFEQIRQKKIFEKYMSKEENLKEILDQLAKSK